MNLIFDICRFRRNPQDIPFSPSLKLAALGFYVLVGLLVISIHFDFSTTLASVALDTILLLGLIYVALWIRGFENRATQTVTALAGVGGLLGLLSIPFHLWIKDIPASELGLSFLFLKALEIWNLAIIGHVLRHALDIPIWAGLAIAITYLFIYYRAMNFLLVAAGAS